MQEEEEGRGTTCMQACVCVQACACVSMCEHAHAGRTYKITKVYFELFIFGEAKKQLDIMSRRI